MKYISDNLTHFWFLNTDTTFQGLVSYYFQIIHPGRAQELNYCVWDNVNIPPLQSTPESPNGKCRTLQETCEDCRLRPIEKMGMIHFTACYKPWFCYVHHGDDSLHNNQCFILQHEWFKARSALEISWGRKGKGTGDFQPDLFLGFCNGWGYDGYRRMERLSN